MKKLKYNYFILICLFSLSVLFNDIIKAQNIEDKSIYQKRIIEFIRNPFQFKFIEDRMSNNLKDQIINILKEPKQLESNKVKNFYDPTIEDVIYFMKYNGFMIRIYHSSYDNKELLTLIEINDKNVKLINDIYIGCQKKYIEKLFGKPFKVDGNKNIYHSKGDVVDKLYFIYTNDLLKQIKISYTFD